MDFDTIVAAVKDERERQDRKWGRGFSGRNDSFWLTILAEEFGEVANAILEHQDQRIEDELVQVAAVVFAWLEFREDPIEQWPAEGQRGFHFKALLTPDTAAAKAKAA